MASVFVKFTTPGSGFITQDQGFITQDQLNQAFNSMNPTPGFRAMGPTAVFSALDPTGSGSVSRQNFINGMTGLMAQFKSAGTASV